MKRFSRVISIMFGTMLGLLILCSASGCERQYGYWYIEMDAYPSNSTAVYELYTVKVSDRNWSYLNTEDVIDEEKKERRITFVFVA